MILKNKADQKLETWNPPTISAQKRIKKALITNKNKPNVNIVTGSVNMTISGLINKFNKDNTIDTQIASIKESTIIPGIMYAKTATRTAFSNVLRIILGKSAVEICIMISNN